MPCNVTAEAARLSAAPITDWLSWVRVKAVGESWIAKAQDSSQRNWDAIHGRAKAAKAMAATFTEDG